MRVGNDGKVYISQPNGNNSNNNNNSVVISNLTLRKQKENETSLRPHVCVISTCRKRFGKREDLAAHLQKAHFNNNNRN